MIRLNPNRMKSNAKAPLYFAAYPLKAVEKQLPASPQITQHSSPYLRALLQGSRKSASTLRVYPMVNPYPTEPQEVPKRLQAPVSVHLDEKDWLKNYE